MTEYVKDESGDVHVVNQLGDGEFTFCDRDITQAVDGGFYGTYCNGPATCEECYETVRILRASIKGVRWKCP